MYNAKYDEKKLAHPLAYTVMDWTGNLSNSINGQEKGRIWHEFFLKERLLRETMKWVTVLGKVTEVEQTMTRSKKNRVEAYFWSMAEAGQFYGWEVACCITVSRLIN